MTVQAAIEPTPTAATAFRDVRGSTIASQMKLAKGTDPVAIDTIGWEVVEKYRADFKLKTLAEVGREPAYIKAAADLGLGIHDRAKIQLSEVAI